MTTLTIKSCYEQHKTAFETWGYGEPIESRHENDILIIKYKNGTWFHYKLENNRLIWW